MDSVLAELDKVKADNETLKADYKSKTQLLENLKKKCEEQTKSIQEANSVIDKKEEDLRERMHEVIELRHSFEDLKIRLNKRESVLKHVTAENDKLNAVVQEKDRKFEEENRKLLLALDDLNEKKSDQEHKINEYRSETESLKRLLSASQKKALEAEKQIKSLSQQRERDDLLFKVEEDKRNVENELKWKKEQFKHLEEALEKNRKEYKISKKEWDLESSKLVDEISGLQTSLDSQTRINRDLQNRLEFCNQCLAHEESQRKLLEVQVSEFKSRYEDAFAECNDAKSKLDCLVSHRDEEVAALRHSLSSKDARCREMEYQSRKLNQNNEELLLSLKELQEANIQGSGNSSLTKLRNKLHSVEQIHKKCSANLRAKEAEWSSQFEKMNCELSSYISRLESKETELKALQIELEDCHSSLLVVRSAFSEAQAKLSEIEIKMNTCKKEGEDKWSQIINQLEVKNTALALAERELKIEREKAAFSSSKAGSSENIQGQIHIQKEVERYKEMLEESSKCQLRLKEQAEIEMNMCKKEGEEKCFQLIKQLEVKNTALALAEKELEVEREKAENIQVQQIHMQEEVERYKERLEESSKCQLRLKEQAEIEMNMCKKEGEEKWSQLIKQLEVKNTALALAERELEVECKKAAFLLSKVESSENIQGQQLHMQKEVERYKEMLEESSKCQLQLKEQVSQIERESKEKHREVFDALEVANHELNEEREKVASLLRQVESFHLIDAKQLSMQRELEKANLEVVEKMCEAHRAEFESWVWKIIAERLKVDLEENLQLRKEVETSLLAQVDVGESIKQEKNDIVRKLKEKDHSIECLLQQIKTLENELGTREVGAANSARSKFESEKESLLQIISEKEKISEDLLKSIEVLEQESLRSEVECVIFTHINTEITFEKEKENLTCLVEQKNQIIAEKQEEVDMLKIAMEKLTGTKFLTELDIEEKKLTIQELEEENRIIQDKLDCGEQSLPSLEHQTQLINERSSLLEEVGKLTAENYKLLCFIEEIDDRICTLSSEDKKLMGKVLLSIEKSDEEAIESLKENFTTYSSPTTKNLQIGIPEERSPFRLLN